MTVKSATIIKLRYYVKYSKMYLSVKYGERRISLRHNILIDNILTDDILTYYNIILGDILQEERNTDMNDNKKNEKFQV